MFGQRDQVVRPQEQVELGGQDAPAVLVEQWEVQHDEDVVVVLVELRALVAREDVLVVERVEIEVLFQPVAVGGARRLDVDPADAGGLDDLRIRDRLGHDDIGLVAGRRRGRGSGRGKAGWARRNGTAQGCDDRTPSPTGSTACVPGPRRTGSIEHPWVGPGMAVVAWAAIVALSSPWGRLWGTGQDAYCYWFPTAGRPVRPVRLDRSDRLRLLAGVPAVAAAASGSCRGRRSWRPGRAILLGAMYVLTGRRWLAVGVVLGADGARRREHPPAAGGGHRARVPLAMDVVARAADEDHARHRVAVVRRPARMAEPGDRARGHGGHRGRVVRRAGPMPGSHGARS